MIDQVAVSADALREGHDLDASELASEHEQLARLLLAHGDVVVANPDAHRRLQESIVELARSAPDAAKYWEAFLSSGRLVLAPPEIAHALEEIDTLQGLGTNWSGFIAAALVEEVRARVWGCPEAGPAEIDPASGIEVSLCFKHEHSKVFGRLHKLAESTAIAPNTDRDALAASRFVPLIARSKHITVVDRFLGDGLVAHWPDGQRRTERTVRTNDQAQEVEWLLDLIGRNAQGARVVVYTAFKRPNDGEAASQTDILRCFRAFVESANLPGIRSLTLFIAPSRDKNHDKFPHERHMRCDDAAFELSGGFDRLRFQRTEEPFSLDYRWLPEQILTLKRNEQRVKRLADCPYRLVEP